MSRTSQPPSLATVAVRGALWAFATTLGVRLISLVSLGVLTRLLVPEQFGLMAVGLVFLTYVETVGDLGTGAALIYWPERRSAVSQITFCIGLLSGLFWFGVAQAGAAPLAAFFQAPEAEPLIRVLALSFPIRALGRTHDSLCQRDLRFRARVLPESAMYLTKGLVAIALALAGKGVWSLVWGQLAGESLRTLSLWMIVPWRPARVLPVGLLAPVLRYGRGIMAVNLLAAVLHHADLVVVGRRLGAEDLGLYQIASKIPEITVALLIWGGAKVLFPALSKVQRSRAQLKSFYLAALRWIAVLALPATVGLFMLAEPLLATLFGKAWLPAVPILKALAVYAGLRALGSHSGDVLKATGRSQLLAGLGVIKAILLLPALVWASTFSTQAVAWSLTIVTAVGLVLNVSVISRLLGIRPAELRESLQTAVPGALATAVLLGLWKHLAANLPEFVVLIGGISAGLVICAATLYWRSPEHFRQAIGLLWHRDRAARGAEAVALKVEAR